MLSLSVKNKINGTPNMDIDLEFLELRLKDTPINRELISRIEHGTYLDESFFIDRFGCKVRNRDMSTGCKAALLVANTDKEVDLQECGRNAVEVIINCCNSGKALLTDVDMTIGYDTESPEDVKMDAVFDGYHFTDIRRFNYYTTDEYGIEPNFNIPGIERI